MTDLWTFKVKITLATFDLRLLINVRNYILDAAFCEKIFL
jgi:hypothetical protein